MHPIQTLSMGDGKSNIVTPEAIVTMDAPRRASTIKTKYVCIAVAFTFLILIVVGGFVGGAYLHKSATKDIMKFQLSLRDSNGKVEKEEVESDVTDDVVRYDLKSDGVRHVVIQDFGKDLVMYRIDGDGNGDAACYVAPLNNSESADAKTVREAANQITDDNRYANAQNLTTTVMEEPIRNTQFLGKRFNELCKGVPIYWSFPSCDETPQHGSAVEQKRAKRGLRVYCRFYIYCRYNIIGGRWYRVCYFGRRCSIVFTR